ncbi:MAG: HlyD family secretion protein [Bacteroidota bacterium]
MDKTDILEQFSNDSLESYKYQVSNKSQVIYVSVMSCVIIGVSCLPFVHVPVYVRSLAVVRPIVELATVSSVMSGRVQAVHVKENQRVSKGMTLFDLTSDVMTEKEKFLRAKVADISLNVSDLRILIKSEKNRDSLKTSYYRQAWDNFSQRSSNVRRMFEKVQVDYNRTKKLHRERVVADIELEDHELKLFKAKKDLELLRLEQFGIWEADFRRFETELRAADAELAQMLEEKKYLTVKAPVSGTVQTSTSIFPGSLVFSNQELVRISPDTSLIADVFVTPNNIGFLRGGMPVRFQVDAFNYNQWGFLSGKVLDISQDIQVQNNQPVFKVKCKLERDFMTLPNGYRGNLMKGMTMQARFLITERSLYQLLYDEVDNWMNPNTYQSPN